MEVLNLILGYLPIIFALVILIGGVIALMLNQRRSAREWLLLAVCTAEKELGGGLGKLKLRSTFEAFVKTFPLLSKFIAFETFSSWVDVALEEMKKMLIENKKVEEYVNGEKGDE